MSLLCSSTQAESKQANGNVFRRSLLNRLQLEYKSREETRLRSVQEWVCFVTFICNIFDYLKVRSSARGNKLDHVQESSRVFT